MPPLHLCSLHHCVHELAHVALVCVRLCAWIALAACARPGQVMSLGRAVLPAALAPLSTVAFAHRGPAGLLLFIAAALAAANAAFWPLLGWAPDDEDECATAASATESGTAGRGGNGRGGDGRGGDVSGVDDEHDYVGNYDDEDDDNAYDDGPLLQRDSGIELRTPHLLA